MRMIRGRRVVIVGLMALVLALLLEAPTAKKHKEECIPSSCGNIGNISYPFRLKGRDPPTCGEIELVCENNRTTLYLLSHKYYVQQISYGSYRSIFADEPSIRLVYADGLVRDDYCSTPSNSYLFLIYPNIPYNLHRHSGNNLYIVSCPTPTADRSSKNVVNFSTCINSSSASQTYFYAVCGRIWDIPDSCNITSMYQIDFYEPCYSTNLSISDIHQALLGGFELSWYPPYSDKRSFTQRYDILWGIRYRRVTIEKIVFSIFAGRTSVGILCLIVVLVYKFRRRHLSMDDTIENFLQSHNNFMPIRYSFSEIKQMTKGFKNKLGQGGYGSVFKAKLRSGHLVAVKLLGKSKANGQDFINEVATIGRIHHVNVVQLIGFCAEGSKRALVYDFMPNGSLDKFIFSREENIVPISWVRMYNIALGVARGIEYLHRGCEMQILHFDIKPHNILLDENFVPKVSDFGLAKLYSTDDSIVSLTAARGTLGYIAPELFYKSIGGVSYKADVYSFGMLLMEMVGSRKNVNAFAEQSSQIYFPSWIYDRINQGEDMELGDATEEVKNLVRKMTLVALWCIQMKPVDRPSMNEVLDMLEGESELMQMPPKPSFYPCENPIVDRGASSSSSYVDPSTTS